MARRRELFVQQTGGGYFRPCIEFKISQRVESEGSLHFVIAVIFSTATATCTRPHASGKRQKRTGVAWISNVSRTNLAYAAHTCANRSQRLECLLQGGVSCQQHTRHTGFQRLLSFKKDSFSILRKDQPSQLDEHTGCAPRCCTQHAPLCEPGLSKGSPSGVVQESRPCCLWVDAYLQLIVVALTEIFASVSSDQLRDSICCVASPAFSVCPICLS